METDEPITSSTLRSTLDLKHTRWEDKRHPERGKRIPPAPNLEYYDRLPGTKKREGGVNE